MRSTGPLDRDLQPLAKGDRVRIVRGNNWAHIEGVRTRTLGLYAYVAKAEQLMSISIRLEEYPDVRISLAPDAVALAAYDAEPEIEEAPQAQSSADVELVERVPVYGQPEYSMYRIGYDEGTATLLYGQGRWELTFADRSGEYDGGEASADDDSRLGAWSVWNKLRAHI